MSTHGWVCVRGGQETLLHDRKYNMIRTFDAQVLKSNGPNIFVQNGDAAHNSSDRQVIDCLYDSGPENPTSHSSTAQIDVPHTHGVTCCWWCCWATVFLRCSAPCALAVLMAVFITGQKTHRMFMLALGLVRAQRVRYHKKLHTLCTRARCWMLRKPRDLPYLCRRPKK